jgi:hypothetical protein
MASYPSDNYPNASQNYRGDILNFLSLYCYLNFFFNPFFFKLMIIVYTYIFYDIHKHALSFTRSHFYSLVLTFTYS